MTKFKWGDTATFQGNTVKVVEYVGGKDRCYIVEMAGARFTVKESELS